MSSAPRSIEQLALELFRVLMKHDDGNCKCGTLADCDGAKIQEIEAALRTLRDSPPEADDEVDAWLRGEYRGTPDNAYTTRMKQAVVQLRRQLAHLEGIRLPHARRQENANGFQRGWHAALSRVSEGDAWQDLQALVPEPAANVELRVHTCHDMNPPFPYECAACVEERIDAALERGAEHLPKALRGVRDGRREREDWLSLHVGYGHTVDTRQSDYDECSCGATFWRTSLLCVDRKTQGDNVLSGRGTPLDGQADETSEARDMRSGAGPLDSSSTRSAQQRNEPAGDGRREEPAK